MTAMSPWTPEAIGKLTPLQLLCISRDRPDGGRIRTYEEFERAERSRPQWTD